jgi:capsular polysaccharide biosynthesis protein
VSLRDVLRTLVRRWYLVLPALIIAVTVAFEVFLVVPPTYRVQARLLLLPSAASSGPVAGAGNPYLSLSAGLGQTAQVIALAVTDEKSVVALSKLGATAAFTVGLDPAANAPIIVATASSVNAANAEKTLSLVVQQVRAQLSNAQVAAGAPKNSFISLSVLTQSARPAKVTKTQLRDGIAAGVGVLIVLMIPIFLFERASLARKARRKASREAAVADRTQAVAAAADAQHESLLAELEPAEPDETGDADQALDAELSDEAEREDDDMDDDGAASGDADDDADTTLNADVEDEAEDADADATLRADLKDEDEDESADDADDEDESDEDTKAELDALDADDDDESRDDDSNDDDGGAADHDDADSVRNSNRHDAKKKPMGSLRVVAS